MQSLLLSFARSHNPQFLVLAALVAGLTSAIALHLHRLQGGSPAARNAGWQIATGVTGGFGIWAAHFILLLAYEPGARIDGNMHVLFASLAVTVGATTVGLKLAANRQPLAWLLGAALMAIGIAYAEVGDLQVLAGHEIAPRREIYVLTLINTLIATATASIVLERWRGERGRWLASGLMMIGLGLVHAATLAASPANPASAMAGYLRPAEHTAAALGAALAATLLAVATGIAAILFGRRSRGAAGPQLTAESPSSRQSEDGDPRPRMLERLTALNVLFRNPVIGFALALIAVIWGVTHWQQSSERDGDLNDITTDASNMARIIGQNVQRVAGSMDTTLKYLRKSYERSGYEANWASLISDEYTSSDLTVQIAAIDAKGIMISSSAMLYPAKTIDLSDREHFKALANANGDPLYISRPMIGRASGQRSVQFARRIFNRDREFGGVIVASLTSEFLNKAFGDEVIGAKSGIALFGRDGIVRAGIGIFADCIEKPINAKLIDGVSGIGASISKSVRTATNGLRAVATEPVNGFPLAVRVVLTDESSEFKAKTRSWLYFTGALIATILVLYVALTSVYNREIYEARIVRLAHFDSLTSVSNRGHFKVLLEQATRARDVSPFALHLIDLDGFKLVNDTHGHPIGDQLLKKVANRLRASLRDCDTISRLGGDEFAIIQPGIKGQDDAAALAQRMCKILAEPFEIEGFTITIGGSIGVAICTDADASSQLLKASDLALYEAKTAGRGTYRFYNREMEAAFHARREIERDLLHAIAAEQFELHYQPIVQISTCEIAGYEALVRWCHPVKGMVPPVDFIPIAEDTGLIVPLGEWIVRKACSEIANCDPRTTIAVNCSTLQFRSANFVDSIKRALADTGLAPHRLELEITESVFMAKDNLTVSRLQELRALGVKLALDDFGTGFSSLSYVMSYPFSTLKIDRSFTSRLCEDDRSEYVIRAICALAGSLGMVTVAEGVEDARQLAVLTRLGCTQAQGYYFSKPKPAREILVPAQPDKSAAAA